MGKGRNIILFTDTYPYGYAETFLDNEMPFLAERAESITIFPLYATRYRNDPAHDRTLGIPNVTVKDCLLPFTDKERGKLLFYGILNTSPIAFAIKAFFSEKVFKSRRKIWIFFNYLLMLRALLGSRKNKKEILEMLTVSPGKELPVVYFYWGDKSALAIPFIKKALRNKNMPVPDFLVRFHGSDLYEEAKGYLPFRKKLYKNVDIAVPISKNGEKYIRNKYPSSLPAAIRVFRLGSASHGEPDYIMNDRKTFRIISCSNAVKIKRLDLIAGALLKLGKNIDSIAGLVEQDMNSITWTHIGDGPELDGVKSSCRDLPPIIKTEFKGRMTHEEVFDYYMHNKADLFIQVSESEGIPVSIMEAFSFGMPVLATDVGGVGELFENFGHDGNLSRMLIPKDITCEDLERYLADFLEIPRRERDDMGKTIRKEWETNWNGNNNFAAFADFITAGIS
ncbi:MAG: glycosyltransferase [Bacteroidales bacterium]|jgi:glycosyltransferase involved in cell wall biosynthesis|nr:glycosyltransferase [Bacteroidales bacterium]